MCVSVCGGVVVCWEEGIMKKKNRKTDHLSGGGRGRTGRVCITGNGWKEEQGGERDKSGESERWAEERRKDAEEGERG